MGSQKILMDTANLYRIRAQQDDRYVAPRDALDDVMNALGIKPEVDTTPIHNSSQFIVLRTSGTTGEPKLLRHPMDFHEAVVNNGIEALSRQGLLTAPRTCLIAISRGRLSGGFLFTYEVVRKCGWSVLLLGASDDSEEIAELCETQSVDTLFMAPNNIGATFNHSMVGRFDSVKDVLYIGEMPSSSLSNRLHRDFPHIQLRPFIYSSNDTGPIGLPTADGSDSTHEVPQNVLVEVESDDGAGVTLYGSGQLLVSVLGLEDPKLIRWPIGDVGILTTDDEGRQTIELRGRGDISVKFHLDSIGGSVILFKSVVLEFLKECSIDADNAVIVRIRNDEHPTVVDVNLVSEDTDDVAALEERFNRNFPVQQIRGRIKVFRINDEEAKTMSPGKRRFFIKLPEDNGETST